jgi:hypothetical protein
MDEQLRRHVARVAGEVEALEGAPGLTLPQMVVQPGSPIDITWTTATAATVTSQKDELRPQERRRRRIVLPTRIGAHCLNCLNS